MAIEREVGRTLRLHRTRLGWTQARLAEAIHVTDQAISKIERGQASPSLRTLEAVAAAWQIPVRDLFPAAHEHDGSGHDIIDRITRRLAGLPLPELEWIEAVLEAVCRRYIRQHENTPPPTGGRAEI